MKIVTYAILTASIATLCSCVTDRQGKQLTDAHGREIGGTFLGAGAGAIIGHQSGQTAQGALLGAAAGNAFGKAADTNDQNRRNKNVSDVKHKRDRESESYRAPQYPDTSLPGPLQKYLPGNFSIF